jgi:hypothetical protein
VIALGCDPARWRSYPLLFREAWSVVVRLAAAAMFTALFWLGYGLSDQLLRLVDVPLLDDLRQRPGFVAALTGLVFGLALAVLDELAAGASPALVVRLLRLLILPALCVNALFLGRLALDGPGGLFQGLSAATLLIGFTAVAVTLVSAAVEGTDKRAVQGPAMRGLSRLLALTVLPLAGWATWAVIARVTQYGWSPVRLAAAVLAGAGLVYGVGYVVAALSRRGFTRWVRRVNKAVALLLLVTAALWLTPVLDAERISAQSQLARFADGRASPDSVDLAALDGHWGRAGQRALAVMRAMPAVPGHAALMARMAGTTAPVATPPQALGATLGATAPADAVAAVLAALGPADLRQAAAACARALRPGVPGCALAVADFAPDWPGEEAILLIAPPDAAGLRALAFRDDGAGGYRRLTMPVALGTPLYAADPAATIAAARSAAGAPATPSMRSLRLGPVELLLRP